MMLGLLCPTKGGGAALGHDIMAVALSGHVATPSKEQIEQIEKAEKERKEQVEKAEKEGKERSDKAGQEQKSKQKESDVWRLHH